MILRSSCFFILVVLLFVLVSASVLAEDSKPSSNRLPPYESSIQPLSKAMMQKMAGRSWHEGCPVPRSDLRLVRVRAINLEGQSYLGELVVHHLVAKDVTRIFKRIYKARFPIASMRPISEFQGDDQKSMKANNSSGFNCRLKTSHKDTFSSHAYGIAIDINPLWNPYISTKGVVKPAEAQAFTDRSLAQPGLITRNDPLRLAFRHFNWQWGGLWHRNRDYQHFMKKGLDLIPKDPPLTTPAATPTTP